MRMSEQRILNNKRRRRVHVKKMRFLLILTIVLVFTGTIFLGSFLSNAKSNNESVSFKYYKSIEVNSGDTLWSIADQFMTEHYSTTSDYISEVISINSLQGDQITVGMHLVIPYYSTDYVGSTDI